MLNILSFRKEKGYMCNECPYVYMHQNKSIETVDIIMLAYNHDEFIEEAIKSVLMQQTQYSYKIKIGEDCSKDSTRQIILNYYNQYPDKIELFLWKENVGVNRNSAELLKNCKGKYIACLEGDDYWTDPFKLEKQVSFLEEHEEYIGTAHNVRCVDKNGKLLHCDFSLYPIYEEHIYGMDQANKFEMISQTASLLYRNIWINFEKKDIEAFCHCKGNGDLKLSILLGLSGDIYCFRDIMADHRRIFQGKSWTANTYNKNLLMFRYRAYKDIKKYMKKHIKSSLNTQNVLQNLFEESYMRLLCKFSKENLYIYLQLLKEKLMGEY